MDLTEAERLALALIIAEERDRTRFVRHRAELGEFIASLAATDRALDLSRKQLSDVAYLARREIETNRYPEAPHLAPLKTAFAKLAPEDDSPQPPPAGPRRNTRRRR